MKRSILTKTLSLSMLLLFSANANATRSSQDFASLIEENTAAQKQLSRELQQQLNTQDLGKTEEPNFKEVGEQVLGKDNSENVAVETIEHKDIKTKISPDIEKRSFKRLSQEIKDIK